MLSPRSVSLFLSLLPLALADTTQTLKTCTTKHGTSSKTSVGSTTYGLTIPLIATKKVTTTPTITVLPTITSTVQQTTTLTITATEQTMVTPAASVIPTPSGFTPLSGATTPVKRIAPPMRFEGRDIVERGVAAISKKVCGPAGPTFTPAIYPSTVTCAQLVIVASTKTLTSTAKATTLTAPIPLTTNLNTVYTTTTTTVTITAPQPTTYAACDTSNIVKNVGSLFYTPGIPLARVLTFGAADAVACCVACQTTAHCATGNYFSGYCQLELDAGTCSPGTSIADVALGGPDSSFAFNGACGHYRLV